MKRSCPGTSTMLTLRPPGSVSHAKPRSIVMPRAFLAQAVRIDAGERFDQQRLAVVHVYRRCR